MKDELKKKDNLITQLSTADIAGGGRTTETSRVEAWSAVDRNAVEHARAEVAALQVKIENVQAQLRDAQHELDAEKSRARELKAHLEAARENEARQSALAENLRDRLREVDAAAGSLESVKSRSEITIQALQREINEQKDKILDLESRSRSHMLDKETAETKVSQWEKKFQDAMIALRSALGVDYNETVDHMKSKIQNVLGDNAMLKGKVASLEESLHNSELEAKASRETISRLVAEVNREQSSSSKYTSELDRLKVDRDAVESGRRDLQREVELLKERLEASQKAWAATKRELDEKSKVYASLDREVRDSSHSAKSAQTQLVAFRDQLASLLTDSYSRVAPSDDLIKEKIRQLQIANKDKVASIEMLENKVHNLTEQVKKQFDLHQDAEQRVRRAELDVRDHAERLRRYESDMATADVFRDGLRTDKEKYLRFMEKLADAMKMNRISAEIGFDMTGEAILARAEQLAKLEADALADRNTHIYNLQRKIKTMKEQLESKDLHLDLLRKKITQLEERVVGRSELEKERDGETIKTRRVERLCEKYQKELEAARLEITDLKAQLLQSTKIKVENQDLEKQLDITTLRLEQIDKIRQKQAKKITSLKDVVSHREHEQESSMGKADGAIQALSSELRTTKNLLDETAKRERQLVDLRTVVARMLGLDINTLAVPDYEIISRLEKLVQAHHAHSLTNWSLERALEDAEDGFRTGYEDARIYLGEPRGESPRRHRSRSPEKRPRSAEKRPKSPAKTAAAARSRSKSPENVDPRKY